MATLSQAIDSTLHPEIADNDMPDRKSVEMPILEFGVLLDRDIPNSGPRSDGITVILSCRRSTDGRFVHRGDLWPGVIFSYGQPGQEPLDEYVKAFKTVMKDQNNLDVLHSVGLAGSVRPQNKRAKRSLERLASLDMAAAIREMIEKSDITKPKDGYIFTTAEPPFYEWLEQKDKSQKPSGAGLSAPDRRMTLDKIITSMEKRLSDCMSGVPRALWECKGIPVRLGGIDRELLPQLVTETGSRELRKLDHDKRSREGVGGQSAVRKSVKTTSNASQPNLTNERGSSRSRSRHRSPTYPYASQTTYLKASIRSNSPLPSSIPAGQGQYQFPSAVTHQFPGSHLTVPPVFDQSFNLDQDGWQDTWAFENNPITGGDTIQTSNTPQQYISLSQNPSVPFRPGTHTSYKNVSVTPPYLGQNEFFNPDSASLAYGNQQQILPASGWYNSGQYGGRSHLQDSSSPAKYSTISHSFTGSQNFIQVGGSGSYPVEENGPGSQDQSNGHGKKDEPWRNGAWWTNFDEK